MERDCGFPPFYFSKALWHSPGSTIALSSNPLDLRQLYKATYGRQRTTVPVSLLLCGQNKIESSQRVEKPHELRLLKWSSTSQMTWNQQASCNTGYLQDTVREKKKKGNLSSWRKPALPLVPALCTTLHSSRAIVLWWMHTARAAFHRLLNPLLLKHEISLGSIKKNKCANKLLNHILQQTHQNWWLSFKNMD